MQEDDPTAVEPDDEGPPKPEPDPVVPVEDDELDTLEEEGAKDVEFLGDEEADADETVDNKEHDESPMPPGHFENAE